MAFALGDSFRTLSSSEKSGWTLMEEFSSINDLDLYISRFNFRSAAYQTNHKIDCIFRNVGHKMKQQLRRCTYSIIINNENGEKIKQECPTRFKVHICSLATEKITANILMGADHDHEEDQDEEEIASGPIDSRIKDVVNSILVTNPELKPK